MNSILRRVAALAAFAAWAGSAAAHPGHGTTSHFVNGLAHPLGGMDHLLAMVAVGLWSAATLPAGRRAIGPMAFIAAMVAGAALATSGVAVPMLEAGVAASVVLLGLMLSQFFRPVGMKGVLLVAAAGLAHGMAHGAEAPAAQLLGGYALGFVLSTAALHAAGAAAGALMRDRQAVVWRVLSAAVTLAGLGMLATRL